jgi:hypothetical protein
MAWYDHSGLKKRGILAISPRSFTRSVVMTKIPSSISPLSIYRGVQVVDGVKQAAVTVYVDKAIFPSEVELLQEMDRWEQLGAIVDIERTT